ncbi:tetratricopeptide repeat protein, partial [Candidatus Omnitrophota bacterium]
LELGKLAKLIFKYNDFIDVCPIAGSFRRHTFVVKGNSGREYTLSLKIPGYTKDTPAGSKRFVSKEDVNLAKKFSKWPGGDVAVMPAVGTVRTTGRFWLYGELMDFDENMPLRINIFVHNDGRRLVRIIPGGYKNDILDYGYHRRIAKELGTTTDALRRNVALEVLRIGKNVLDEGYKNVFADPDLHLENILFLTDGRVMLVADFTGLEKASLSEEEKREELREMLEDWIREYELDFDELYKEALNSDEEVTPYVLARPTNTKSSSAGAEPQRYSRKGRPKRPTSADDDSYNEYGYNNSKSRRNRSMNRQPKEQGPNSAKRGRRRDPRISKAETRRQEQLAGARKLMVQGEAYIALDSPETAKTFFLKAVPAFAQIGEFEDALIAQLKTIECNEALGDNKELVMAYISLGILYQERLNKPDEAIAALKKVVEICIENNLPVNYVTALIRLGNLYKASGQRALSSEAFDEAGQIHFNLAGKAEGRRRENHLGDAAHAWSAASLGWRHEENFRASGESSALAAKANEQAGGPGMACRAYVRAVAAFQEVKADDRAAECRAQAYRILHDTATDLVREKQLTVFQPQYLGWLVIRKFSPLFTSDTEVIAKEILNDATHDVCTKSSSSGFGPFQEEEFRLDSAISFHNRLHFTKAMQDFAISFFYDFAMKLKAQDAASAFAHIKMLEQLNAAWMGMRSELVPAAAKLSWPDKVRLLSYFLYGEIVSEQELAHRLDLKGRKNIHFLENARILAAEVNQQIAETGDTFMFRELLGRFRAYQRIRKEALETVGYTALGDNDSHDTDQPEASDSDTDYDLDLLKRYLNIVMHFEELVPSFESRTPAKTVVEFPPPFDGPSQIQGTRMLQERRADLAISSAA